MVKVIMCEMLLDDTQFNSVKIHFENGLQQLCNYSFFKSWYEISDLSASYLFNFILVDQGKLQLNLNFEVSQEIKIAQHCQVSVSGDCLILK